MILIFTKHPALSGIARVFVNYEGGQMSKSNWGNLSLSNLDFRRKMMATFAVVSVLPVLISFYLLYDQILGGSRRVSIFLFIATMLSMMGLFLFIDIIKQAIKSR